MGLSTLGKFFGVHCLLDIYLCHPDSDLESKTQPVIILWLY